MSDYEVVAFDLPPRHLFNQNSSFFNLIHKSCKDITTVAIAHGRFQLLKANSSKHIYNQKLAFQADTRNLNP